MQNFVAHVRRVSSLCSPNRIQTQLGPSREPALHIWAIATKFCKRQELSFLLLPPRKCVIMQTTNAGSRRTFDTQHLPQAGSFTKATLYIYRKNRKSSQKTGAEHISNGISPSLFPHYRSLSNNSATAAIANLYEIDPENPAICPPVWSSGSPLTPSSIDLNPRDTRLPR